jgi:hypothetical protein
MKDFPARFSTGCVKFYERRNTEAGPESVAKLQVEPRLRRRWIHLIV